MQISTATFIASSPSLKNCPDSDYPEFAFIGRSNVGKSSLINMLTGNKSLAKVSGTPGKTRLINHFLINDSWYLVDLPGYGYAKVSKTMREKWMGFTSKYLTGRPNLMCLFQLIDSRIEPQAIDLSFSNFLGQEKIPFVLAFTKSDKITTNILNKNISSYRKEMSKTWEQLPRQFITSSQNKIGRKELLEFIQQTNLLFNRPGKNP